MQRRSLLKSLFIAPFLLMVKKEQQEQPEEEEWESIPIYFIGGGKVTIRELKVRKRNLEWIDAEY